MKSRFFCHFFRTGEGEGGEEGEGLVMPLDRERARLIEAKISTLYLDQVKPSVAGLSPSRPLPGGGLLPSPEPPHERPLRRR